ncbi:hypothetical protein [Dyella sp. A6]|uniref:hypothetical protein n=1 Tax=Dyella aluminiiresistens TaxID=3069105 RepID=UPI002E79D4CB|nr:hypothetical protein [Dyella sp. A6]
MLPRLIYRSFDDEAQGDEYVTGLEALLDRGVVLDGRYPSKREAAASQRHGVRCYLGAKHVSVAMHVQARTVFIGNW